MVAPGGAVYDCDECCAADPTTPPPCDKCPLPWGILPEVETALDAWCLANKGRQGPQKLTPVNIQSVCAGLGLGAKQFRLVTEVEAIAYPLILEGLKQNDS